MMRWLVLVALLFSTCYPPQKTDARYKALERWELYFIHRVGWHNLFPRKAHLWTDVA